MDTYRSIVVLVLVICLVEKAGTHSVFTLCDEIEHSVSSEVWIINDINRPTDVDQNCACHLSSPMRLSVEASNISLAKTTNHCDESIVIKLPNITDQATFKRCSHTDTKTHEDMPLSIYGPELEVIYAWMANAVANKRGDVSLRFRSSSSWIKVKCFGSDTYIHTSTKFTDLTSVVNEVTSAPDTDGVAGKQTDRNIKQGFQVQDVILAATIPSILALIIVIILLIVMLRWKKRYAASNNAGAVSFDNTIYSLPQVRLHEGRDTDPPPLPNGNINRNNSEIYRENSLYGASGGVTDGDSDDSEQTKSVTVGHLDGAVSHNGLALIAEPSTEKSTNQPVYDKLSSYQTK